MRKDGGKKWEGRCCSMFHEQREKKKMKKEQMSKN